VSTKNGEFEQELAYEGRNSLHIDKFSVNAKKNKRKEEEKHNSMDSMRIMDELLRKMDDKIQVLNNPETLIFL